MGHIIRFNYNFIAKVLLCGALLFSLCGCGVAKKTLLSNENIVQHRDINLNLSSTQIDSLREIYGNSKIFVEEYIEPTLIALSFFPELTDVPIEFKVSQSLNSTMAALPNTKTIIGRREYIVLYGENDSEIPFRTVPYIAQIGIIAHELTHIVDYINRNVFELVGLGFGYLFFTKSKYENIIDMATIERGLGWQLYEWADFSFYTNKTASEKYKKYKKRVYMTPSEIKYHIQKLAPQ